MQKLYQRYVEVGGTLHVLLVKISLICPPFVPRILRCLATNQMHTTSWQRIGRKQAILWTLSIAADEIKACLGS